MEGVGKENAGPGPDKTSQQMIAPPPQSLSQRSATKDLRDCPQTPLGRLPLSELLASGEDKPRQHLHLTPIERVLWDNSPMSSIPGPAAKRKRKRAHSSSPASSSQNDTSNHFAEAKPAVDLHTLQKALKTPKADPADDLWSRYSLNTDPVDERSPTTLGYSHLMHSSSPQTPATHPQRESGSLRRALSCVEWPTSVAKRRKINHSSSQGDSTKYNGPIDSIERSKVSRVSLLIEKIQDGLSKPITCRDEGTLSEPPRSSPAVKVDKSPSRATTLGCRETKLAVDEVVSALSQTGVAPKENGPRPLVLSANEIADMERDGCSSDFGDDDLDLEMLETMETHTVRAAPSKAAMAGLQSDQTVDAAAKRVLKKTRKGNSRTLPPAAPPQSDKYSDVSFLSDVSSSTVRAAPQAHDEFDEDENEVSAADLEDMFVKYDSQPPQAQRDQKDQKKEENAGEMQTKTTGSTTSKIQAKPGVLTPVNFEVLSDNDDFGDDSDFEQIAAECEATQEQQVAQPQSSVRTLNFGLSI